MSEEILYHYCSLDSFKSIVESRSLRLSSLSLSNDSEEGRVVRKLFRRQAMADNLSPPAIEAIDHGLAYLEESFEGFGFCLSKDSSLLDQWRVYASDGQGVSIGFSRNALENIAFNSFVCGSPVLLEEVSYDDLDQWEMVKGVYDSMRSYLSNLENDPSQHVRAADEEVDFHAVLTGIRREYPSEAISSSALALIKELYLLKHGCFANEREVRFFSVVPSDRVDDLEFSVRRGELIPHAVAHFPSGSAWPAVREVVLGPKCKAAKSVVSGFLRKNQILDVDVYRSDLPYK